MKTKLISAVLALVFTASCSETPKIIFNPDYENDNSIGMLEISKIELADKATFVHFNVYHKTTEPENWFRISAKSTLTGGSGKIYNVIGSEGIVLDAKTPPSEIGFTSFIVIFEPLDKDEKTIDYKEGEKSNDWRIIGIKLYSVKQAKKAIQCTLKGKVINRPSSFRLALFKEGDDPRTVKPIAYIPIKNGKFEYVLNCDYEEMYTLMFPEEIRRGSMATPNFISENEIVDLTFYSLDESYKNKVEGGKLNAEYCNIDNSFDETFALLEAKREKLEKDGKAVQPEFAKILEQAKMEKDDKKRDKLYQELNKLSAAGKYRTPEAQEIENEYKRALQEREEMKLQYAAKNHSIAGYIMLVDALRSAIRSSADSTIIQITELYNNFYAPKYPDHPYTEKMKTLISSAGIKKGGRYIDFEAPDFEGNNVKLSEQIKGKIAILYFWALWCGPCIQHGKEMIPIYETYKNKGFTVVSIIREGSTAEEMKAAVEKYKFPWLQLVELKDAQLYMKYGIGNAGGGDFLVDRNGVILSKQPTIEEVEKILKERLE